LDRNLGSSIPTFTSDFQSAQRWRYSLALFTFFAAIMAVASLPKARHIDPPAALTRLVDVILGYAGLLLRAPRPTVVWTCASLATIGVPIARALDLQQPIGQLYHTGWTAKDGLAGMNLALAQTADGYLWVGTTQGLYRFNGISFEQYQPEEGMFPSRSIFSLFTDRSGGLWIGYLKGGASYLKNGRVTNYSVREGIPFGRVRCFAEDWDGTIWVATIGGLGRLDGRRWVMKHEEWNYPGNSPDSLFVDDRGTLWAGTGKEIVFLTRGSKKFSETHIRSRLAPTFAESADGTVWYLDLIRERLEPLPHQSGWRDSSWRTRTSSSSMGIFDRDGCFWHTDENGGGGIWRFLSQEQLPRLKLNGSGPSSETFNAKQGLTGNSTYCVLEDREGNIWVGTDSGIDRFRHRNLSWYSVLPGPHLFSLVAGENGNMWAGADPGRVVHIPDGKVVSGSPKTADGAYHAPDGTIWLYPLHKLFHWQNESFREVPLPGEAISDRVNSFTMSRDGTLWASIAGSGEFYRKDGKWEFVKVLQAHPDWTASTAYTDASDRVWLALQEYAAAIDHGRVEVYSREQGLAVGPILVIGGNPRQLWIGGENGLALLCGNRFRQLRGSDGTDFGVVTGLVATSGHGLWLTTTGGIVHIFEDEIQKALKDPGHLLKYEVFDVVSDLPKAPNSDDINPIVEGSDGVLWIETTSGVARLDPAHVVHNPIPPPVSIRSVTADGRQYSAHADASIPPLTKEVRFDYDGLSLTVPERVKFRYRLEGLNQGWVDAGVRRQAFFTNLAPGRYAFEVLACNNDGVWTSTPAVWRFVILPAYYQTLLFKAALWTTAIMLLWLFYLFRLEQISAEIHSRHNERQRERERIARELHDTLLQGFQGLVLRFQAILNRIPEDDPLRASVSNALLRADDVLIEGRDRVREIRSEPSRDLHHLVGSFGDSQASESTCFQLFLVGTVVALKPLICAEAYCIAREALTNAFRHASAGEVEAELIYDWAQFNLRIRDNGTGIDEQTVSGGRLGHWGLEGMRERANLSGGKLSIWSRPGVGTEVELVIPGKLAYAETGRSDKVWWWKRLIWGRR
jgi:signal transduction histidine kinase/ligand-binding sensor domain-containing protein